MNALTIERLLRSAPNESAAVEPDVRALTSAVASGDAEAFTRFFGAWFDRMYAEARRATARDEAFCLDVVQDAMMRVIRSLKPIDNEDDLRRWLRAVVHSCAYDRLRGEARRRRREKRAAAVRDTTAADPGPRMRWLEEQLRSLDGRHLHLLVLRHRLGWTLEQIGAATGLKPGAVDGRLRRLVAKLRKRAREETDD